MSGPDNENDDPLGPAKGIVLSIVLSAPLWVAIYFLVRWLLTLKGR